MIHEGSRGGPLVTVADGRIIGILSGRFEPHLAGHSPSQESPATNTNISYAVSVQYGADLLEAQGVELI